MEMNRDLVSVIVPVYKVEKYLPRCIESILNQSYENIEIILVDDGSPDQSGAICDEYAGRDGRVKVIHKKNGGVSAARNSGLSLVTGKYLTFCDSDDSYAPGWIAELVENMEQHQADCVVGNFSFVTESGEIRESIPHAPGVMEIPTLEDKVKYCILTLFGMKLGWEIWLRMFRADIILNNNIRFCETCENFAEDLGFVIVYSLFCDKVVSIPKVGYNYLLRQNSMMRSSVNTAKLNAVNEVSQYVSDWMLSVLGESAANRVNPILHWMIMENQYRQIFSFSEPFDCQTPLSGIRQFEKWQQLTKQLQDSGKDLEALFGKKEARRILCMSRFWLHRNWWRFKLEHMIAVRLPR